MLKDFSNDAQYEHIAWGPWRGFFAVLLAFVVGQLVAGFALVVVCVAIGISHATLSAWLGTTAGQFVAVALAEVLTVLGLWLFLRKRLTSASVGLGRRPRWKDLGTALVVGLIYIGALILISSLASSLAGVDVNQEQDIGFKTFAGVGDKLMILISLVILPPIVEEILFRGVLFGGLRKKINFTKAALITSALFAVPHLLEGEGGRLLWIGAIDTFVLSMALCYLRERTKGLWASISLHMMKNGLAYLALFIFTVR